MIVDRLENCAQYGFISPLLREGFRYLADFDLGTPDGRIELQGSDLFALVQTFTPSRPEKVRFEAHLRYLDVQCVVQGNESIYVEQVGRLTPDTKYDPVQDIAFFRDPALSSAVVLRPGDFALLFPQDAHKPNCVAGDSQKVRKVVLKFRLAADEALRKAACS